MPTAIERAVSICGSQRALAAALHVKPVQVHKWCKPNGKTPPRRCIPIEEITGVTRYELRPDVFGSAPIGVEIQKTA